MKVHVFTIDTLPIRDVTSTGGGLRSLQIVRGLEKAGAKVTYSMPYMSADVRKQWDKLTIDEQKYAFDIGSAGISAKRNPIDILNKLQPDAAVYLWPPVFNHERATVCNPVVIYDINGLQNVESALIKNPNPNLRSIINKETASYVNKLSTADLLVTGSREQNAYWMGLYSYINNTIHTPGTVNIPYFPSETPNFVEYYNDKRGPKFVISGSFLPWNSPGKDLRILSEEIEAAGRGCIVVVGRANPFLPHAHALNREIESYREKTYFDHYPSLSYKDFSDLINGNAIGFDLHGRTLERELALPIRSITYLTHGAPIITNTYSQLSDLVSKERAGWVVADDDVSIRSTIRQILNTSDSDLKDFSKSARISAQNEYRKDSSFDDLLSKAEKLAFIKSNKKESYYKLSNDTRQIKRKAPVVLIISDDMENFLEVRVRIPFDAMYRSGKIDGYHVINKGNLIRSVGTRRSIDKIDAVWVQRVPLVSFDGIISLFGDRFVYDIDDNLLITPSYRPPFSQFWCDIVKQLLKHSSWITTTSPRLVASLQFHSGIQIEHKVSFAPNVVEFGHPRSYIGKPDAVLLASSDTLALTSSREPFFKALEAFLRSKELPLYFIGANTNRFRELGSPVVQIDSLNYAEYRHFISTENFLAVAPLETNGDGITNEFVSCKSDIKMAEFGASGIPGVFADAAPYRDSTIDYGSLIDCGDASAVYDGLDFAFSNADVIAKNAFETVIPQRLASHVAPKQWVEPILNNLLSVPMSLDKIHSIIKDRITRVDYAEPVPEVIFSAHDYLALNPDVAEAVQRGDFTAYEHYVTHGSSEGRAWFPGTVHGADTYSLVGRYRNLILSEPARIQELELQAQEAIRSLHDGDKARL